MSDELLSSSRRIVFRRLFIIDLATLGILFLMVVLGHILTDNLGALLFALGCGVLGATASMFRRIRSADDTSAEQFARDWISTGLPLLYGGILACFTYLLFMSGILSGDGGQGLFTSNLFPNFGRSSVGDGEPLSIPVIMKIRPLEVADFGKLLVWSFVAGYSEKFVLGILSTLESKH